MTNQTVFTVFNTTSLTADQDIIGTSGSNSGIAVGLSNGIMNIKLSYNSNGGSNTYGFVSNFFNTGPNRINGMALNPSGNMIYWTSFSESNPYVKGNAFIYGLNTSSTGPASIIYNSSPQFQQISQFNGITVNSAGKVYTISGVYDVNRIYYVINSSTIGGYEDTIYPTNSRHYPLTAITRDSSSNIYVLYVTIFYTYDDVNSAEINASVYRLDSNNNDTEYFYVPRSFLLSNFNFTSMVIDSTGVFYIADSANHIIYTYNASAFTPFAGVSESAGYVNGTGTNAKFNNPSV
jgi:hypothetical protein